MAETSRKLTMGPCRGLVDPLDGQPNHCNEQDHVRSTNFVLIKNSRQVHYTSI